jgi:hypothetical protein
LSLPVNFEYPPPQVTLTRIQCRFIKASPPTSTLPVVEKIVGFKLDYVCTLQEAHVDRGQGFAVQDTGCVPLKRRGRGVQ